MKWLTTLLPYLAVAIGVFWIHNALWALVGFHFAILLAIWWGRSTVPVKILFQSKDIRWVILSILICGSSGISLYFLWSYFGVTADLSETVESFGLSSSTWPIFITYFVLVNPPIEEYYWRGYLGSPTKGLHLSDFFYAGYHVLVVVHKVHLSAVHYSLVALVMAGWLFRQLARKNGGLLAPALGHMAADLSILMAIYLRSR